MSSTVIPVHIKSHLIPFLVKKLKYVDCEYEGAKVKGVKITTHSNIGKYIHLLLPKSFKKHECIVTPQILFIIEEQPKIKATLAVAHKYEDVRSTFCNITMANQELINDYLQDQFETAMMYYIKAHEDSTELGGIREGIIRFLKYYNLEDYGYSEMQIRQDFYRKRKKDYFTPTVEFNPVTSKVMEKRVRR